MEDSGGSINWLVAGPVACTGIIPASMPTDVSYCRRRKPVSIRFQLFSCPAGGTIGIPSQL